MNIKTLLLTLFTALCCTLTSWAAEIPSEYMGKWVTLKTENGYYFYAIEEDGKVKLGQTGTAPTSDNYAAYCWQIEGNATDGYTFRCLKYQDQGAEKEMFITNPQNLVTNDAEVLLSNTASRYYYTDKHQLQLMDNEGKPLNLYLAFFSWKYTTIRLHNSADYIGSRMIIGAINDWSVAAIVYGTEKTNADGTIVGTTVPDGGITFDGKTYKHASSFYVEGNPDYKVINVTGYTKSTIKIDHDSKTIVAYYIGSNSGVTYKEQTSNTDSYGNAVTGEDNTFWTLIPKNYITNTSRNYTNVPAGKVWQMRMVVQNTNTSGDDPHFNQWGSCILASGGDPLNTYYWNEFQVYQHAPTHASPNTLNFKSNKADGMDHIIAQGVSVKNKNYKVVVTYNGDKVYVIRTIILDANLNETDEVYNNVWVAANAQKEINQLSCALPTGLNLKSLEISIAEESNLLEGVDYAIQNNRTEDYCNGNLQTAAEWHSPLAGNAAKYQIAWTGNDELTYTDSDGGLHHSFYIKLVESGKWLGANNTLVDDKASAQPFIYATSNTIEAITAKNTTDNAWKIDENNKTWEFVFFANFYVEVAGMNLSTKNYAEQVPALKYTRFGETQFKENASYIELPSNADVMQFANTSQLGYSAAISQSDIRLKVQYTALDDTFYNFTETNNDGTQTLYYWYKPESTLVTYSATKNSDSGNAEAWKEKGDCRQWKIVKATSVPVKFGKDSKGDNYYCSVYFPNAMTIPEGAKAYTVNEIVDQGNGECYYMLQEVEQNVLPKATGAILISESDLGTRDMAISQSTATIAGTNILEGIFMREKNPFYKAPNNGDTTSDYYVLSTQDGIGFYPYIGAMIPAFKAFYHDASSSQASRFRFSFGDEEEQSITAPSVDEDDMNASATTYNLMGQRVDGTTAGNIYFINGKKMIIK